MAAFWHYNCITNVLTSSSSAHVTQEAQPANLDELVAALERKLALEGGSNEATADVSACACAWTGAVEA